MGRIDVLKDRLCETAPSGVNYRKSAQLPIASLVGKGVSTEKGRTKCRKEEGKEMSFIERKDSQDDAEEMPSRNTVDILVKIGAWNLVRYGHTTLVTYRQFPEKKKGKELVDILAERMVCYGINQPIRLIPPEVINSKGWHDVNDASFSIRLQLDDWKRETVGIYLVRIVSFETRGERPASGSRLIAASVRSNGECDLTADRVVGTFFTDRIEEDEAFVVLHPDSSMILMLADVAPKKIQSAVKFRFCLFRSFV